LAVAEVPTIADSVFSWTIGSRPRDGRENSCDCREGITLFAADS
jgi:hypothetical protein